MMQSSIKIVSCPTRFSLRTGKKLAALVAETKGIIVLPITEGDLAAARMLAKDTTRLNDLLKNSRHVRLFGYIAAWALSLGKAVLPLYSKQFFETGRRVAEKFDKKYLDARANREEAEASLGRLIDEVEIHRLHDQFERFRKTKPGLIVAPDYQALVLHRLFRGEFHQLAAHDRGTDTIVKRLLGRSMEIQRGRPKPKRRPKPR